jgi:trehalose 6-phosphate synthase
MDPRADLILANRAYLDHQEAQPLGHAPNPAAGGLLAAVRPAIQPWDGEHGTTWIGAGRGPADGHFVDARGFELIATPRGPLRHRRLFFDQPTWDAHYGAVANSFLWPLLHLVREGFTRSALFFPRPATPDATAWERHVAVNRAFASAALEERPTATAWVHDYQLTLVPDLLRRGGFAGRIGFFLHTPFPLLAAANAALDDAGRARLVDVVRGMLGADLIGFQTEDDAARFVAVATALELATEAAGALQVDQRTVRVGAYPVGIDAEDIAGVEPVPFPPEAVARVDNHRPLVAGLERSDFTKGIPERLRAVAGAYSAGLHFAYAGVAAPTRGGVALYEELETVIAREADVARHAASASPFVHARASIAWPDVVAVQRAADVVFTSSIADGMNLVPLQAAIAQRSRPPAERGIIIAGRDAGVARVYAGYHDDGLIAVDPLDHRQMVEVLGQAVRGTLPRISDRLIATVERNDARAWATRFLGDLEV